MVPLGAIGVWRDHLEHKCGHPNERDPTMISQTHLKNHLLTLLVVSIVFVTGGCSKDDSAKSNDASPTEAPLPIDDSDQEPLDQPIVDDVDSSGSVFDSDDDGAVVTAPDADDPKGKDDGGDDNSGDDAAESDLDSNGQGAADDDAADDADDTAAAIPAGWGRLKATAIFVGKDRPGRKAVPMGADPFCVRANAGKRVGTENWIVNSKMQVANVVVYVKEGADGEYETPTTAAKLDQNCCVYIPHVQTLMTDQPLTITNSDTTLHNVHSLPTKQRVFNKAQPKKGDTDTITFKRPEFVKVKCDVHPWMSAYLAVFDHPFSAVTNKSGAATIDLPPGKYTIGAWHEETDELATQAVTVRANETTEINLSVMK